MQRNCIEPLSLEEQNLAIISAALERVKQLTAEARGETYTPQHIGYFFLMDENGNPIKNCDLKGLYELPDQIVIEPAPMSEDLKRLQMVGRAFRNSNQSVIIPDGV